MTTTTSLTDISTFAPEPGAQTEQELVYEFFRDEFWPDEAYLVFANKFNRPIELSSGKMVILPMPTVSHQRIIKQVVSLFDVWLQETQRGEVLFSPHPIRLWPGKYREPDVMVWLTEHRDRIGEQESSSPDIAIEVVSPSTELHDTDTKLREYAEAGIIEYWIINPRFRQITIQQLEGRAYKLIGQFRAGERARSVCLSGFEIAVDDVFLAK